MSARSNRSPFRGNASLAISLRPVLLALVTDMSVLNVTFGTLALVWLVFGAIQIDAAFKKLACVYCKSYYWNLGVQKWLLKAKIKAELHYSICSHWLHSHGLYYDMFVVYQRHLSMVRALMLNVRLHCMRSLLGVRPIILFRHISHLIYELNACGRHLH